jgi:hypothetical protein
VAIVGASPGSKARSGSNRRRYRRVRAPFHCRPAGVDFFAQRVDPVDISFGGLRIYCDEEHALGAVLRLDVFFPSAAPVTCATEVVWIKALGKGAPARLDVGLAFVELSPAALKLLLNVLGSDSESADMRESDPVKDDVPISDVRPATSEPATVRQDKNIRAMLSGVPVLVAGVDHLRAGQLDGRAGFILSLIDGVTTVENLLDLSGMPADETLAVLEDLRQRGIVAFESGSARGSRGQ